MNNIEKIKELRQITGVSISACKKAIEASQTIEQACLYLRKHGEKVAKKKAKRIVSEGRVHSYVHGDGKISVSIEVNCETDFAAQTFDFKRLVKDLSMHIAAMNPSYIDREDVPEFVLEQEHSIIESQLMMMDKASHVKEKIKEGFLDKFYQRTCLLDQAYYKDDDQTVRDVINAKIGKLGENIIIKRFCRYELGESIT